MVSDSTFSPIKSPLKFPGGKGPLASWIISLFPPRGSYTTYVEPFFGGGSVLFAHNPNGKAEIVNDLNGALINLWKVLADESLFKSFSRRVAATPFCEDSWEESYEINRVLSQWSDGATPSSEWAAAFFVMNRQSMMGLGEGFAPLSINRTRGGMLEQASAWWSAVDKLPQVYERIRRVGILNQDGIELVTKYDEESVCEYIDPPYIMSERSGKLYEYEMTDELHGQLIERLLKIEKAKVLLSGYQNPLYRKLENAGWTRIDLTVDNKMSKMKKKPTKIESVWRNFSVG